MTPCPSPGEARMGPGRGGVEGDGEHTRWEEQQESADAGRRVQCRSPLDSDPTPLRRAPAHHHQLTPSRICSPSPPLIAVQGCLHLSSPPASSRQLPATFCPRAQSITKTSRGCLASLPSSCRLTPPPSLIHLPKLRSARAGLAGRPPCRQPGSACPPLAAGDSAV